MKLLPPQQIKDNKNEQDLRGILRTQELNKAADKARLELAKAEAEFNATLAKNRSQWASEEAEHTQIVNERKNELDRLESKRQAALQPLTEFEEALNTRQNLLDEKDNDLRQKESDLDILAEQLQDKLDVVGIKEQDLNKFTQEVQIKAEGLAMQVAQTKSGSIKLGKEVAAFKQSQHEEYLKLNERHEGIKLIEISVAAQLDKVKARQIALDEQEARIKSASDELDAKRKKALMPVAKLETEAKELKAKAAEELALAKDIKTSAILWEAQIKNDLDNSVKDMVKRENALALKEQQAQELYNNNQNLGNKLKDKERMLDEELVQLEANRNEFTIETQAQNDYLNKEKAKMAKQAEEANTKKTEALETLKQAQLLKTDAEADLQMVILEKGELQSMRDAFEVERQIMLKDKEANDRIKASTQTGLEELMGKQESFALWRFNAEKLVTDKEIKNKELDKQLTTKQKELEYQETFLADWNTRLKDERETLAKAWKELEAKQRKGISP